MPETDDGGWLLDETSLDPYQVNVVREEGTVDESCQKTGKDEKKTETINIKII